MKKTATETEYKWMQKHYSSSIINNTLELALQAAWADRRHRP